MTKREILIVLLAFAIVVILLFKIYTIQCKSDFFRNRNIEYEYLRRIVIESKFELENLESVYNVYSINKNGKIYVLKPEEILNSEYFKKELYMNGASDFFGYEFIIDSNGKLEFFSFYKP